MLFTILEPDHTAVELIKRGQSAPVVPQSAMQVCVEGEEVTAVDPVLKSGLRPRDKDIARIVWSCQIPSRL